MKAIVDERWKKTAQMDEGIKWVEQKSRKEGKDWTFTDEELNEVTGVGVIVTQEQITQSVNAAYEKYAKEIESEGHDFNFGKILLEVRELHKWGDGGLMKDAVNGKRTELLGEAPANDGKRKKKGKMTTE